MKHQLHLSIKKPCAENFNKFLPTDKGGFCNSCRKEVIDFTQMNNKDIAKYFKSKTTENTCGRFTNQQLKTTNNLSSKNRYLSFFTSLGFAIVSFLYSMSTQAQELKKSTKTTNGNKETEALKSINNILVKGTVITESDGLPLPGANVFLQGSPIGTQTDFDGYFEFPTKLKKGDVLIISYIGMESKKVIIENKKSVSKIELVLDMTEMSCIIMGEVAVKEIFKSKDN
ncbi:carboxypeptidase-like regulatory domain-containing protein [Winogradskyella sp.]|uniref:carboxypeptidase-like regulatory domain-containing protein n=1 Tax=Winogradskyella sp. TaxID=1883156 RepID=UPI0026144ED4|nr:carboxypeptidase-like regulatory domain-containing protein [Winogradskyella sp.]